MNNVIFITGTDTGVGKTVLTGLLLAYLRQSGCRALAMKPFCSGGLGDVRALRHLQGDELTPEEISPFFFPEPVAPLVAARKHGKRILIGEVLERVRAVAGRCEILLVEGAGGLLVPLGEGYTMADVIARLNCDVILVAANRLGTINHTLLTAHALLRGRTRSVQCVLMERGRLDASAASNGRVLSEWLAPIPVVRLGFLGRNPLSASNVRDNVRKSKKSIARLCASSIVCGLFFANRGSAGRKKVKNLLTPAEK